MTFTDPTWLEEERRCVAAARRGDRAAFRRLYELMAPPLFRDVLLPRLGDAQAAEDVLAESFQAALEGLASYQDRGGSIWSWLVTIARNRAHDRHRERARGRRAMDGLAALLAPVLEVPSTSADDALDGERLRRAVARTLEALNPRYKRALELRFFDERPRVDCAAALEVKVGTFDVLLLRALRAFHAAWLESAELR